MKKPENGTARIMSGQVKWFDPGKGFGFVLPDSGGPDILLHANVVRNFGQGSVADGAKLEMSVQDTDRGLQAIEILSLTPPQSADATTMRDLAALTPEEIAEQPVEPARVKWFDKIKGFGFANVWGSNEDVFLHIEVLRRAGLADLQTGEAIGLSLVDGERGRLAVGVVAWESAAK